MDTKHWLNIGITLSCMVVVCITTSLAYFAANITHNNVNETRFEAASIGSINYNGTLTFTENEVYPGMKAIQTFTIEKGSQEGTGIYEIDLASTVPEMFGSDIEITLYKTTTPEENNVERVEGELTQTAEGFIKEDQITINGTPEIVYGPEVLTESEQIILEQKEFDTSTLERTTYYLVYNYKNNGDQNAQQGQTFSGKVTVRLISELNENEEQTAVDYILSLVDTSDELVDDETEDHNIRYTGANPNNYVSFNNELWRIIGVFNNIDNGSGTKETRIKLIRDESIGEYSWDNKRSGTGSSTSSSESNDWTDSTLKEVLNNGPYWNRTSGDCPSGREGATTSCDFSTNGLTEEAKTMISDAIWNLGGSSTSNDVTASMFYERERGTTVYSGRPTTWTGKIGLMYPSDYGYATSGGSATNRETCLNKELHSWNSSSESDCKNNDWLYDSSNIQWTLTPFASYSNDVFDVNSYGFVYYYSAYISYGVSPALYLNSNVKISGGSGTEESPYTLSL